MQTKGTGAIAADQPLQTIEYKLHELRDHDIHIEVHYCGVCHSDIHCARSEWPGTVYPLIPGHEATGVVKAVGPKATKFKVGDHVGVGVFCGSCRDCEFCNGDEETMCAKRTLTYNDKLPCGSRTYGGYGKDMFVDEHFVFNFNKLDMAKGAPILCAGVTVYSAIKDYGLDKPGTRVGVTGLGGLGHMAVLLLKGLGVDPVVISRSESKRADAEKMGAVEFILSTDKEQMAKHAGTLHGIVDTVAAQKDFFPYLALLRPRGAIATVGLPPSASTCSLCPAGLISGRKIIGGAGVGGVKQTQELLDFCAEKNIYPWVEMVTADKLNAAYTRVVNADVKYRFVLDVKNSQL